MNKILQKKKIIALLLIMLVSFMSACKLVSPTPKDNNSNHNNTAQDDYMVGFVIKIYNQTTNQTLLPIDLSNDKTQGIYVKQIPNIDTEEIIVSGNSNYFYNSKIDIVDGGVTSTGKINIDTTLYFTYEMINNLVDLIRVYRKTNSLEYYIDTKQNDIPMSVNIYNFSINKEQVLDTVHRNNLEINTTTKFTSKFNVNFEFIDHLTQSTLIEYNSNNEIIKSSEIDLTQESIEDYTMSELCEYLVLKDEYTVKHNTTGYKYPQGTKYTQRTVINKSSKEQIVTIRVPLSNGLVQNKSIKIQKNI